MQFDYSEQTWKVGKGKFTSPLEIDAWDLALYKEKLQEEVEKSPFGKSLPPKNSPSYDKEVTKAIEAYTNKHQKFAALIACECILTPVPGSPTFAESVKGLNLVEVSAQLGPVINFFFESVKRNMPNALVSQKNGKASKGTRKGNPSKTTSR